MGTLDPGACSQSNVHCPEKRRRMETNYRLEISKFPSRTPSLQDGRLVHVAGGSETRMAHGKDRLKRCLFNHSYNTGTSVSAILWSWGMDAVQVPPIRALYRTIRILKGNKATDRIPETARDPVNNLSRRSSNSLSKHSTTISGSLNGPMANDLSGVLNQYPKEHNVPNPTVRILGVHSRLRENDNCTSSSQGGSYSEGSCMTIGNGISADRDIGTVYWDSSSNQASGATGAIALSSSATCEITSLEP